MFPSHVYTRKWSDEQRRKLGNCDPGLLEKCVHALAFLGHVAESGLPLLFKGGTSLLLHLPEIRRLSIDIDIGVLFEHATDFAAVARAYDGVQAQESGYRQNLNSREACLDDTFNACLGLTASQVRRAPPHPRGACCRPCRSFESRASLGFGLGTLHAKRSTVGRAAPRLLRRHKVPLARQHQTDQRRSLSLLVSRLESMSPLPGFVRIVRRIKPVFLPPFRAAAMASPFSAGTWTVIPSFCESGVILWLPSGR
jgi:Nucleotidyl transferase AbiEii toxin, Type IV TA system